VAVAHQHQVQVVAQQEVMVVAVVVQQQKVQLIQQVAQVQLIRVMQVVIMVLIEVHHILLAQAVAQVQ
jgi:hypothetical protein